MMATVCARPSAALPGRCLHHLARELVADDAGVGQERLLAPEDVEIRAADAGRRIRTSTSPSLASGSGRSTRASRPGSSQTIAFMRHFLPYAILVG